MMTAFLNLSKLSDKEEGYSEQMFTHLFLPSLAIRLNNYMYSNGTSLNLGLFILMTSHLVCRITMQLLGMKIIPCRVASLIDIQLKQKDLGQSSFYQTVTKYSAVFILNLTNIPLSF